MESYSSGFGLDETLSVVPSSPEQKAVHPSLTPSTEDVWLPDELLDVAGGEEVLDEPWAPGLRLREKRSPAPSWRIEPSEDPIDVTETVLNNDYGWEEQQVLGHMALGHSMPSFFGRRRHFSEPPRPEVPRRAPPPNAQAVPHIPRSIGDALTARLVEQSPRIRGRRVLPLAFTDRQGNSIDISACPDSGSAANIMSLDTVKRLGHEIMPFQGPPPGFCMANGKLVHSIGQVNTDCIFSVGASSPEAVLACVFDVFVSLAVPLIVGMQFLEDTETYSKHQSRLIAETSSPVIRVNSVGWPKKVLLCALGTHVGPVTADTGADLNFVSATLATNQGFAVAEKFHEVMFADGSTAVTSGMVTTSLAIALQEGGLDDKRLVGVDFHVLEGLSSDIVIGQDTVEDLDVFNNYHESFISRDHFMEAGIIRYVGKVEKYVSELWRRIRGFQERDVPEDRGDEINQQRQNHLQELAQKTRPREGKDLQSTASGPANQGRGESLPPLQLPFLTATPLESISDRSDIDHVPHAGSYMCTMGGYRAALFESQYPLNSRLSVHSAARPHYCPVAGCARSEGGTGFKRKNELIRHGRIHESPGYLCPFCKDRDHRFPKPDNLQRHVRVHHPDKDKNDPLLIQILSQRSDGMIIRRR